MNGNGSFPGLFSAGGGVGLMPDILGFTQINSAFSDVLGVIRDAFQALGDDHQMETSVDRAGLIDHEGSQLAMGLLVN